MVMIMLVVVVTLVVVMMVLVMVFVDFEVPIFSERSPLPGLTTCPAPS